MRCKQLGERCRSKLVGGQFQEAGEAWRSPAKRADLRGLADSAQQRLANGRRETPDPVRLTKFSQCVLEGAH